MTKIKKARSKKEKKLRKNTIKYNIINSFLTGAIFFAGTIADGDISWRGLIIALGAASAVAINKFQKFWKKKGNEIVRNKCDYLFNFL